MPGRDWLQRGTELDTLSWYEEAACLGQPSEVFFPVHAADDWRAKQVCAGCPVRRECLQHALSKPEDFGVWGGLNEAERVSRARAATPTRGSVPLELVTYTTNARSTGSTCSAGRTATGWGVFCQTHKATADAPNRTAAEYAVSRPEEWCPKCGQMA